MDYIALGCMSGTSLDGIDLSLIRSDGETYTDEILNYFQPYSKELRRKLNSIIQMRILKAEVEKVSVRTAIGHG